MKIKNYETNSPDSRQPLAVSRQQSADSSQPKTAHCQTNSPDCRQSSAISRQQETEICETNCLGREPLPLVVLSLRRRTYKPERPESIRAGAPRPRRARRDALPEHTRYLDSGCDIHPSCLSCPLSRCRFDEPGGARKIASEDRDRRILALCHQGSVAIDSVARRFGVSRRTVFRVLARARGNEPP